VRVTFDLIREPWLPVVGLNGLSEEVGLARLLLEAHTFRRIVGETPPMTAALYRLALALAHRVYGPADHEVWGRLWRDDAFPAKNLQDYLDVHGERFDLFDAERPFLQCPAVKTSGVSSPAKLVPHRATGNNTTLFDHTTASDRVLLTPKEAARWLVALQAYDPGGLKTPYRKDKSSERAPCNSFGVVLVEGATLKETLLLNMLVYSPKDELPRMTMPDDYAAWEGDRPPEPEPGPPRSPVGWTELLTWPSRRVWLSHQRELDQPMVDRVVITPGTRLRGNLDDLEGMAAFRRLIKGSRESKKSLPPLLPVRLERRRGIWRHSQELLLAGDANRRRPRTLDNLSEMVEKGYVPVQAVYTVRVFGQQLDSKGAVAQHVMEEAVAAPVALLRAESSRVGVIIGTAVKLADDVGSALRDMERDHRAKLRAEPSADLELAYWPRLPEVFDVFIRSIGTALHHGKTETPAAEAWAVKVRQIADKAARQWAEGSPRHGRNLLAVGEVYGRFTGLLDHLVSTYLSRVAGFVVRGDGE
jgi:CRISPR system Cascade subunit CasA